MILPLSIDAYNLNEVLQYVNSPTSALRAKIPRIRSDLSSVNLDISATALSPTTGKAIWGALMGPFKLVKRQDFASEVSV
jgi:hypothetical protein